MKHITRTTALSLALLLGAIPWISGQSAMQLGGTRQSRSSAVQDLAAFASDRGQAMSAFEKGPGVINLAPGDEYAEYQWALKNSGEFKLIELTSKFKSLDDYYSSVGGGSGSMGLPQPGPGDYTSTVTQAADGLDINILPAWDLYNQVEQKRSVIVAIIDTGIDYSHPELQNAMWVNPGEIPGDGIDNEGDGYIDDVYGWNFYQNSNQTFLGSEDAHGTHAAGTISSIRGSYGITGITDNQFVKLMSLKALGGQNGTGTPEAVSAAIRYAEAHGASICNLSMGTTTYNEELFQTIQNSNMLFVVACGNGNRYGIGYDIDKAPVYPASFPCDNIISVANQLFDGNISKDSNFGASSVDIAAPGSYILSTIPGGYGFMSGTSMAAPMVTGVAAMLYSARPEISLSDVKTILINSSRKLDQLAGKTVSQGMLEAYNALSYR